MNSEQLVLDNSHDIDNIISMSCEKIKFQLEKFQGGYPEACSIQGAYPVTKNTDWTTGFWSGMTSLAWRLTGDDVFLKQLEEQVISFSVRLDNKHDIETHDLGFLYSLSCVNTWKITGNRLAYDTALRAAHLLSARYLPVANIIQAWGDLNDPLQQGRMIIDCLMNLPLLYWAGNETGEKKYIDYAYNHAIQAMNYLLREDNSTFHTFYMDIHTGEPVRGSTHQGYSDSSCWARGQAWAIYGFALSYRATGNPKFLESSKRAANYFIEHLPEDNICYWDLSLTESDTHKDSSAAVIAACGLLELANHIPNSDLGRKYYIEEAFKIVNELFVNYFDGELNSSGYLKHSVYNMNKKRGIDEYCTWGDYFFIELLSRLKSFHINYW